MEAGLKIYIVRIYRNEKDDNGQLAGVVEETERGEKTAFKSPCELLEIMDLSLAG